MAPDETLEREQVHTSYLQRATINPINAANTARHEGRLAVARVNEQIKRLEKIYVR